MSLNIYFISESIPHNAYGSFVIFYRHLNNLRKKGYEVNLIVPSYKNLDKAYYFNDISSKFNIIQIPFNKWWFPPYRIKFKLLRDIRFFILHRLIKKHLKINSDTIILSYLHGQFFNGFATYLKRFYNCKLGFFLHDDKELLYQYTDKNIKKFDLFIAQNADLIWTVSKLLKINGAENINHTVLPPIPQGLVNRTYTIWKDDFTIPSIGFAGTLYKNYIPVLKLISKNLQPFNGKLKIISNNIPQIIQEFREFQNIEFYNFFEKNEDALTFLAENCTAIFCGYPDTLEGMPWLISCFPSKFVEYTHTGLPIILSSPNGTALEEWAIKNEWNLYLKQINDSSLNQLLHRIITKNDWILSSEQSKLVAQNEFNPTNIQADFEASLKI